MDENYECREYSFDGKDNKCDSCQHLATQHCCEPEEVETNYVEDYKEM